MKIPGVCLISSANDLQNVVLHEVPAATLGPDVPSLPQVELAAAGTFAGRIKHHSPNEFSPLWMLKPDVRYTAAVDQSAVQMEIPKSVNPVR